MSKKDENELMDEIDYTIRRLKILQNNFGGNGGYEKGFWDALEISIALLGNIE